MILYLLVVGTLLTGYLALFPSWFDSGELSLGIQSLSVTHPTGQPLYTLIGKFFALLPIGTIGFRTALFSLVCGLASIALVSRLAGLFTNRSERWLIIIGSSLLLAHVSLALQITRTEVYSLALLTALAAITAGVESILKQDARLALLSSFCVGLSFSVHPVMSLALLPLPFFFAFHFKSSRIGFLSIAFIFLGGLIYLYLPLRAATEPVINWDHPVTLKRLWGMVTALDYQSSLRGLSTDSGPHHFGEIILVMPWALLALSFLGMAFVWVQHKRASTTLIALAVASLIPWLLLEFVVVNPDMHGYALITLSLVWLLAMLGAVAISRFLPFSSSHTKTAVALIVLVGSTFPLLKNGTRAWADHGSDQAETLSRMLDVLPPFSLAEVGSDHWLFPFWYRMDAEGRRPDVAIIGSGLLPAKWYRDQIVKRYGVHLEKRLRFTETSARNSLRIIGTDPEVASIRNAFLAACRINPQDDPFGIQQSICAQIILTWTRNLASIGRPVQGISLLEYFLQLPETHLSCTTLKPIALPFPLFRNYKSTFLSDPDQMYSELMLLYLGCQRRDLAEQTFLVSERDVDARLLFSALLWQTGKKQKALDILETEPLKERERATQHLARATYKIMLSQPKEAGADLKYCEKVLGENDPAVKKLRTVISGQ